MKVGGIWERILNDLSNQEPCAGRPYFKLSNRVMVIDQLTKLQGKSNWLAEMSEMKDPPFTDGNGWVGCLGDTWKLVHGHLSELRFVLDLAITNGMLETRNAFERAVPDHYAIEVSIVAKFPGQVIYKKRDGCLSSCALISHSNAKTDPSDHIAPDVVALGSWIASGA